MSDSLEEKVAMFDSIGLLRVARYFDEIALKGNSILTKKQKRVQVFQKKIRRLNSKIKNFDTKDQYLLISEELYSNAEKRLTVLKSENIQAALDIKSTEVELLCKLEISNSLSSQIQILFSENLSFEQANSESCQKLESLKQTLSCLTSEFSNLTSQLNSLSSHFQPTSLTADLKQLSLSLKSISSQNDSKSEFLKNLYNQEKELFSSLSIVQNSGDLPLPLPNPQISLLKNEISSLYSSLDS